MATTSLQTPSDGDQPKNRDWYVCPQCETRIPCGTDTTPPGKNCPTCNRRLWIPTVTATFKPPSWWGMEENPYESPTHEALPSSPKRLSMIASAFRIGLMLAVSGTP